MAGWQKNQEMQQLFSNPTEKDHFKKRHLHIEKYEKISKVKRSDSVRSLVALAAQISRRPFSQGDEEEVDGVVSDPDGLMGSGYWSNPEDQLFITGNSSGDDKLVSDSPSSLEGSQSLTALTAWSDSELQ